MNFKKAELSERTKLERFLNKFQLSHPFKKVGFGIVILSFILLTLIKFIDSEPEWFQLFLRHAMIVGLLVISISRENIEDELIESLRSKSYSLAFIIGVLYILLQPLANYIVDLFLGTQDAPTEIGYIQVLLFMLLIQVGFFELLKRTR